VQLALDFYRMVPVRSIQRDVPAGAKRLKSFSARGLSLMVWRTGPEPARDGACFLILTAFC
jgi:hypothetical protein